MKFKMVRIYHKPYKIFKNDLVVNVGQLTMLIKNEMNEQWLTSNMDLCIESDDAGDCEFGIYKKIVDKNILNMDADDYICCQAYSKMLDITDIQTSPFRQLCSYEESRGNEITQKSLIEFGFGDIEKIFKYNCILGNLYPCPFTASLQCYCKNNINQLLQILLKIINRQNSSTFSTTLFIEYLNSKQQFWTAAGIFKYQDFCDITSFSYMMLKEFKKIDSLQYMNNPRVTSLLLEIFYGFCIWCIMKKYMINVGFVQMIRDANVTFSRNEEKTLC